MHHVGITRRSPTTNHSVVSMCGGNISMCFEANVFGVNEVSRKASDLFQDGSPQIPSEEKATAQLAGKPEGKQGKQTRERWGDISRPFL